MVMEVVRSSITALLFLLTLVVLAAATTTSSSCGGDDAAAAEQCHGDAVVADEPYALITFQNKGGEERRLVADQRSEPPAYGFGDPSGNWFYAIREAGGNDGKPGRRRLPLPLLSRGGGGGSRTEGLWNALGALANTNTVSSDSDPAADDEEHYVFIGLQTGAGDKIRFVAVADQRSAYVTGYAKGFSRNPRWSFRDGERQRVLLSSSGGDGSHDGGRSHGEVVASSLLAALMKEGSYAASSI